MELEEELGLVATFLIYATKMGFKRKNSSLERTSIGICKKKAQLNCGHLTRHVEVIVWQRAVDSFLGHQHEVGSVCLGDTLADVPKVSQLNRKKIIP